MNKRIPFDDHIKEILSDYEADVPAYLWDNINEESNKKKPFFFWFFKNSRGLLILISTLILAGVYNYLKTDKSAINQTELSSSIQKEIISSTEKENNHIPAEPVLKSNYSKQNSTNMKVNAVSPGIDLIVEKPSGKEFQTNQHLITDRHKRNSLIRKSTEDALSALSMNRLNSTIVTDEKTYIDSNLALVIGENESMLHPQYQSIQLIKSLSNYSPVVKANSKTGYNIPCPTFNNNANRFYTDFYAALDVINRQFSDTAQSIYLQKRKEGNTVNSAYSLGIRVSKLFKSGITIRGGINYSQINEKFQFTQGNIIQTIYETNTSGDTIGSYQTISTRYKITHNHYRNIDFPFTIGYEKSYNNWGLNINGGVIFNLFSTYKGDILDKNMQPVDLNESTLENRYKLKGNIGMGYTGGVSVYYNITERLKVLAEPYFRYNISPMNQESSQFKQRYNTIGLRAGIRADLR